MVNRLINKRATKFYFLKDLSFWLLLATNFIIIYFAITQKWRFFDVLLSTWIQTSIIGLFNLTRLRKFKKCFPNEFKINHKTSDDVTNTFLLLPTVYLIFIFVIFILTMLVKGSTSNLINVNAIIISAISFFINNLFSFFYNKPKVLTHKYLSDEVYSASRLMIPMHLTVILTVGSIIFTGVKLFESGSLMIFLLGLKSIIDVAMHVNSHKKDPKHLKGEVMNTGQDGIYGYRFKKISMIVISMIIGLIFIFTVFYSLGLF